jgi:hypothetical protein
MIKLSRVVISHAGRESISIHAVKQNIELLMNGLIGLGLAFILMPQVSLAVDDHISQAIEHTNQAIDDGKHGRADGVLPMPKRR